jgi:hypothetical protein
MIRIASKPACQAASDWESDIMVDILTRLIGVRQSGNGRTAKCPAAAATASQQQPA